MARERAVAVPGQHVAVPERASGQGAYGGARDLDEGGLAEADRQTRADQLDQRASLRFVGRVRAPPGRRALRRPVLAGPVAVRPGHRPVLFQERGQRDLVEARQRMSGRQQGEDRFGGEGVEHHTVAVRQPPAGMVAEDRRLQPVRGQLVEERDGGVLTARRHLGLRQQRLDGQDQSAEQGCADRADADAVAGRHPAGHPGGVGDQTVDAGEDGAGPVEHQLAERGGDDPGPAPGEQHSAQHRLDAAQLCAESGLGRPESGGGAGEAARLGDRAHHAQMAYLQVHGADVMDRRRLSDTLPPLQAM